MRTYFVFIRTGDGGDAFHPGLFLQRHGDLVFPAGRVLSVLLREVGTLPVSII